MTTPLTKLLMEDVLKIIGLENAEWRISKEIQPNPKIYDRIIVKDFCNLDMMNRFLTLEWDGYDWVLFEKPVRGYLRMRYSKISHVFWMPIRVTDGYQLVRDLPDILENISNQRDCKKLFYLAYMNLKSVMLNSSIYTNSRPSWEVVERAKKIENFR